MTIKVKPLQDAIIEAEAVRQTFCLASPGTYEEFNAYLSGFDMAVGIFRKAIERVDPATIRAEVLREAAAEAAGEMAALGESYLAKFVRRRILSLIDKGQDR